MQSLLSAQNIIVSRQGTTILKDVSIKVDKDDFITIIGPNGAGKSMLLQCLMGFYKADRGAIHRSKLLKIGYMPQKFSIDQTLPITVDAFLKLMKKVNTSDYDEIIEETKITPFLNKQLFTLSGGQMQRVLLARSLIGNPNLLVLDEPAQNLDLSSQMDFYKLLEKTYKKRSLSILMVSHDLHLVMASSKKVICLFGHVCCSGEPQMVAKDPEFVSLFGKDMAKMMAVYNHSHDHDHSDMKDKSQC